MLADDLRGMLATIESGEIEATTTMCHRIEGALARHRPPRPRPARWSPAAPVPPALVGADGAPPHRTTALAQVIPAPKPENKTRSPSLRRPVSAASASAIPQDAVEVLPVWSRQIAQRARIDTEPLADGVDDPEVRLVRDE